MSDYVGPNRWNDKTAESNKRARQLRKEVAEGADAQRYNYVFGTHSDKGRAEYDALNKELNAKEEEAEALDQRMLDQYPKGTTSDGRTSRNRAGYGKPVDIPSAENDTIGKKKGGRVHASKRADGIAQRGHTRYRGDKG